VRKRISQLDLAKVAVSEDAADQPGFEQHFINETIGIQ